MKAWELLSSSIQNNIKFDTLKLIEISGCRVEGIKRDVHFLYRRGLNGRSRFNRQPQGVM